MTDVNSLGTLLALAILTEATVQIFIKDTRISIFKIFKRDLNLQQEEYSDMTIRFLSAVIGIAYAFNMNVDIFQILGYTSQIPWIGTIASGLIASRGSNYMHDLLGRFTSKERESII